MGNTGGGFGFSGCFARLEWDPRFFWAALAAMGGLLLVGVYLILLADRWRKHAKIRSDPSDQLAHFRELYEQGELSSEEFDRVRALLQQRLMQQLQTPEASSEQGQPPQQSAGGPADSQAPTP
jgi:hypothetical protein